MFCELVKRKELFFPWGTLFQPLVQQFYIILYLVVYGSASTLLGIPWEWAANFFILVSQVFNTEPET